AIIAMWGKLKPEQTSVIGQTLTLLDDPIGRFGNGAWIGFADWCYVLARIFIVVGLAGAAVAGVRYLRRLRADRAAGGGPAPGRPLPLALAVLENPTAKMWSFHLIAALTIEVSVVYYAVTVVGWTATRLMYPAFASLVMLCAAGWLVVAGPRWHKWVV